VAEDPDTTIHIAGVTVSLPRAEQYRGTRRVVRLDSSLTLPGGGESVGELLQRLRPVAFMQYGGAGALSSLSLRGAPSAQTLVNWNGFPLNARTSGMADLSQLPAALFERVLLVPGAAGSLYGSGTAGGALNLDNRPRWHEGLTLRAGAGGGSFASGEASLALDGGSATVQSNTHLFYQAARNDYPYRDDQLAGAPVVTIAHNACRSGDLLHNTYVRLPRQWLWQGGLWLQKRHKELPAPMGAARAGTAEQRDSSLRLYSALTKQWRRATFSGRAAWFFDNMRYTDKSSPDAPDYSLDSRFRTSTVMGDFYYKYTTQKYFVLDAGLATTHTTAHVTGYGDTPVQESSLALYGGVQYVRERWRATATLRQGFHSDAAPPPQGSLGLRYRLLPALLTLHTTLSTRYRLPTLNDRYWVPGGNAALDPEHGWGAAGGLDLTLPRHQEAPWRLSWQSDAYYNLLHDQIRWIPAGAYWQPENVEEVRSRGLENTLDISWHHRRLTLHTLVSHHLTVSTVTGADGATHDSRYIPRHAATATLRTDYGIFFSGLYLQYAGRRSTTTDNDPLYDLDPYLLTSLVAGIKAGKEKVQYHLQLTAGNLFNVQYQVIRSYAMPGRSYTGKLIITFKTK
jgi:outer membrane cobalamin receptor